MAYVKTYLKRDIIIDSIITVHYFEYLKDFVFRGESHDFWELLYVDKGTISVRSDNDWHTLNTGDVIFHKPNEFHAIESIGTKPPNLIAMSFTTSSPAIEFFQNKKFTLEREERDLISAILREVRQTFSTPIHIPSVEQVLLKENTPFASQQLILLYLELFLITVYRNHSKDSPRPALFKHESPEQKSSKDSLVHQITQYLEFHIFDPLNVDIISNAFSISRSSLQSLFHEKYNCGVIDYFNAMKIERAKEIIRDGTMNFTEISYYLSYSSLSYFSKQFKKRTGMSPLEYSSSVKGLSEPFHKTSSKNK